MAQSLCRLEPLGPTTVPIVPKAVTTQNRSITTQNPLIIRPPEVDPKALRTGNLGVEVVLSPPIGRRNVSVPVTSPLPIMVPVFKHVAHHPLAVHITHGDHLGGGTAQQLCSGPPLATGIPGQERTAPEKVCAVVALPCRASGRVVLISGGLIVHRGVCSHGPHVCAAGHHYLQAGIACRW